ncbi:hypothetical protein NMY22_g12337 [Coprinellus aureogranulatus]|nr:hypothetical protein NMY22_g12337 [Coprinellus aureogranulatus]
MGRTATTTTMAAQLPDCIVDPFVAASPQNNLFGGNLHHGSYNMLLHYLFGTNGEFVVQPRIRHYDPDTDPVEPLEALIVKHKEHPVMLVQVKSPGDFVHDSKRHWEADEQMHDLFHDLRPTFVTPRIPGISAFGTSLSFYEYDVGTDIVTPGPSLLPMDSTYMDNVVPTERWNYVVLEADGFSRVRQEVRNVARMCHDLVL